MRWLITGGCGFIGSALVARLVAEGGHTIRVLDNLSSGSRARLAAIAGYRETPPGDAAPIAAPSGAASGLELVIGDVRDVAHCLRAAEGAEAIVHLAAAPGRAASVLEPRFDCETGVGGTLNMLEAARYASARRFVFTSSNEAYGECPPGANAPHPAAPVSPHGAAKLAGEGYCAAYFRSYGIETAALRLGNVYGPGDGGGLVARFVRKAMRGERLDIHGDGRQTRDFVHIDDAVAALVAAATAPIDGGETWQVSGGEETSIGEVVDLLVRLARHAGWPRPQVVHGAKPPGCVAHGYPGPAGLPALPGWAPQVDFASGLARTVRWYMDHPEGAAAAA